jgi:SAM-dependent methyltransferase
VQEARGSEMRCPVCGGRRFEVGALIWPELASEWRLSPEEVAYINRQQGGHCTACGVNFRSMALARAICSWLHFSGNLPEAMESRPLAILEINEAGLLTPFLQRGSDWTFARYPEVDIHAMPYPDRTFDLVVHSDTLEHVAEPIRALAECRRVLKPGGACCYTVPLIVGRLSIGRAGLPRSYHGAAGEERPDFLVHTEFGADAWTHPIRAGFHRVTLTAFEYPSALAFTCEDSDSASL